jgi:pimeloyl-ACP methyl ester carboxylesterase
MDGGVLNFRRYGSGPPLVLLHGLFGSADNWHSVAGALSAEMAVYAVDLRNHGRSFHSAEHDYASMAEDVRRLAAGLGLGPFTVLGHSMGGKAALALAAAHPQAVARLIVVDITHKATAVDAERVEALRRLDLEGVRSLKEASGRLEAAIPDTGLRLFLLKNLERTAEGRYRWRINLESIGDNIGRIGAAVALKAFPKPCLFIRGGKSDYIREADWEEVRAFFPAAELRTIPEAGHWVHTDAREAFVAVVSDFIRRTS